MCRGAEACGRVNVAKTCTRVQMVCRLGRSMWTHVDVCRHVLTYVDVCGHQQKCAVGRCVQTCADMCGHVHAPEAAKLQNSPTSRGCAPPHWDLGTAVTATGTVPLEPWAARCQGQSCPGAEIYRPYYTCLSPILEHRAASSEGEGCAEGLPLWLMETRDPTQLPGARVHHPGGLGWTAGHVAWGADAWPCGCRPSGKAFLSCQVCPPPSSHPQVPVHPLTL